MHEFLVDVCVMPKTINVASIDYDGCLSHKSYQGSVMASENPDIVKELIEHNPILIQKLQEMQVHRIMVGSNRQEIYTDAVESQFRDFKANKVHKFGSCFPALEKIASYVGASFEDFVLADMYSGLQHGHTVREAKKHQENSNYTATSGFYELGNGISSWEFDHEKVSIVYAQIQKLALENPEDQIVYSFIDDREEILKAVENFFIDYPEMIPSNVTIKTMRYYDTNPKDAVGSNMILEERKTISPRAETKPNPYYDLTLRRWARENKGEDKQIPRGEKKYKSMQAIHNAMMSNPLEPECEKAMVNNTLKNDIDKILDKNKSTKKFKEFKDFRDLRIKLGDLYRKAFKREVGKGNLTLGFSAVLRDMSAMLKNKYPDYYHAVRDDIKEYYQRLATNDNTGHYVSKTQPCVFLQKKFDHDWDQFTGANAGKVQIKAKEFILKFKQTHVCDENCNHGPHDLS